MQTKTIYLPYLDGYNFIDCDDHAEVRVIYSTMYCSRFGGWRAIAMNWMFGWNVCAMPVGANTVFGFLQFSQQLCFVHGIHLGYKCLWDVMASASSLLLYLHFISFYFLNGRKQLAFFDTSTHILCQYYFFFSAVMNTDSTLAAAHSR